MWYNGDEIPKKSGKYICMLETEEEETCEVCKFTLTTGEWSIPEGAEVTMWSELDFFKKDEKDCPYCDVNDSGYVGLDNDLDLDYCYKCGRKLR